MGEYYNTKNGLIDISGYDENQKIKFFMVNPDAEQASEYETRRDGYTEPNSDKEEFKAEALELQIKQDKQNFNDLKFGKYRPNFTTYGGTTSGTRTGGLGDNVSRDNFKSDEEWQRYQIWNGDIEKPVLTLGQQVEKQIKENDLDVPASGSHYYYNQNKNNSFVERFYEADLLTEMNVNIEDFQGYLNREGYSESFEKLYKDGKGAFDASSDSGLDVASELETGESKEQNLKVAYQRQLYTYLREYMEDVNQRATQQTFIDDYNKNPNKYSSVENLVDAYELFNPEQNFSPQFYKDPFNKYMDTHFKELVERGDKIEKLQQEFYNERINQSDEMGAGLGTLESIGEVVDGFVVNGAYDMATTIGDWIGFDSWANERRFNRQEVDLMDAEKQMEYMRVSGKGLKIGEKEYIVNNKGVLYDTTTGLVVGESMNPMQKQDIIKKVLKDGTFQTDWSTRGGASLLGNTLGNVVFQLIGTKGAGTLRTVGSVRGLKGINKLRKGIGWKNISTRARGSKGRFKSTKETFGVNVPFDPRIVDATVFQGFYGATTGYENTITQALQSGIPYDEAVKLAQTASGQMALLYSLTGPINPRLPGLNKLDEIIAGRNLINRAIDAYKQTGREGFRKTMSNGLKRFTPGYRTLSTIRDEGVRETIQENIQQIGEMGIVNRNVNQLAGEEFLKQDYTLDDFIQTSVLSFAAGGIIGGASTANFSTRKSKTARLQDMWLLGRDMKDTKKRFDLAVDSGKITQNEANDLIEQIEALSKAKFSSWMLNTPDELLRYVVLQEKKNKLENDKKKLGSNEEIRKQDEKIKTIDLEIDNIVQEASKNQVEEDVDKIVGIKGVGKENVIKIENENQLKELGFQQERFSDGWLEGKDGKIYIYMPKAVENQAISVASHELLHKILKAEFKNNPKIKQVVDEFKEILKEKGLMKVLEPRANLYRAKHELEKAINPDKPTGYDIDGKDMDEWLTIFSDSLRKKEISYESLKETDWISIGRRIANNIKIILGIKGKYEFETGRQVYDFVLDYNKNIEKGKLSSQAQRMLDSFTPDDDKKRSINMEKLENQEKLNELANAVTNVDEWIESQAFGVAKSLIDQGSFDKLIGSKIASGKIYGKSRAEIMEESRDELVKHLERYNPEANNDLFGYLNSYVAFKVGTVTNRAKKNIPTISTNIVVDGKQTSMQLEDTGKNPEEIMIAKEEAARRLTELSRLKIGKKFDVESKKKVLDILLPIIRDLDTSLLGIKSINAKNSPIIKEIKKALGNSLVFDFMIKELGSREDLKNNLLLLKETILQNSTTTWLMGKDMGDKVNGGIPQAIDKVIKNEDGSEVRVSYPDWVGKEIAREKTGTDNAGRTSGHDLVFRSDNLNELSDDAYLSQFYDSKGKLIRGRKEALAKHLAQEVGIEFLIDEIANNKEGATAKMFNKNQLAKNVLDAVDKINLVMEQAERGGVKRSLSFNPDVAKKYYTEAISLGVQRKTSSLQQLFDGLPSNYKFIENLYNNYSSEDSENLLGFIQPIQALANQKGYEKVKDYIEEFLSLDKQGRSNAIFNLSSDVVLRLPLEFFNALPKTTQDQLLGFHDRVLDPGSKAKPSKEYIAIRKAIDKATEGGIPFSKIITIQGGSGIVAKITDEVLNTEGQDKLKTILDNFGEDIDAANSNNHVAMVYFLQKNLEAIAENPGLIPGYLSLLMGQSNLGKSFRALSTIEDIEIHDGINQAPFVSTSNSSIGYRGLTSGKAKKGYATYEDFENGKVDINRKHPNYKEAKEYIDNTDLRLREEIDSFKDSKTGKSLTINQVEAKQKQLNKSEAQKFQERLRIKGEHKNPNADKMFEIAAYQLAVLNIILSNPGSQDSSIIQSSENGLLNIVSNHSQSIGTEVLSAIQDRILGTNSSIGDGRALVLGETKMKAFMAMPGFQQMLGRAKKYIENEVYRVTEDGRSEFAKMVSQQKALDNSRKRSFSLEPKGISVYDFDDTLAFSDSKIIVKMPNGKTTKITPEQFAKNSAELESQGAVFNFSEFDKVVKGRPGPLAPRLKKAINKFGNENIYVLTARPQASARAIYDFLKGIGLEIPIQNITGLENGTPAAKAAWVVGKVAQGYNDFYFVDDVYKNVKAVQDVLNVFDVKGKVQQAVINRKRSLSGDFNKIIEKTTGVKAEKNYSKVLARKQGAGKGRFKVFIPYSAEDFRGLTSYTLSGKGKQGELDQQWFEDNLVTPYARGVAAVEMARQATKNDYNALLKQYPKLKKLLNKQIGETGFTYDQAVRVYLYNKSGYVVDGISKRDLQTLLNVVNKDPEIKAFANDLQTITKKQKWTEPEEFWDVGSILKDLNTFNEKISRKEYLAEFIENVDIIFSEKNLNKLQAIYGTKYRDALENIIKRMKSGSNRPGNVKGAEGKWLNWMNNSVGTIMFFNRRSALLQMLSFSNFVNWSDNNPIAAAKAFANQPLYWKTWVKIFNSDKLKQRRGGLKSDLQEQEIANQAMNSKDKASAIISYLLKIGFTPTQIADSMAIATGGSTFLINRTKTYLKQGMSQAEADKKAFEDFSKISDETQQSGDPMLISQQQSSHLGRLILAFQNTPMQYTRLMKKAGQDLINRRGDDKTNISKILYYGFIQNLIFNSLQQALFAMLPAFDPDDDEDEYQKTLDRKTQRIANNMVDTILRGSGIHGAVVSTLKNTIMTYYKEDKKGFTADHTYTLIELANVSPPIGSKFRKVYTAIQTYKFNKQLVNERGFELTQDGRLNIAPAYEMLGNLVSAGFNVPLDRAIVEINAISEVLDNRNNAYQKIALLLGFRTWDVNAKNEENEFIKLFYKELKALEKKKNRKRK